jgi:hypothetical protein
VLDALRRDLDRAESPPGRPRGDNRADEPIQKIQQHLRALQGRLEGRLPGSLDDRVHLARGMEHRLDTVPTRAWYFAVPGSYGPSMRLRVHADPYLTRVATGWGLLLLGVLGGWSMQRRTWQHFAARWWPAAGVSLGLFWWLFLVPSLAGWLIIAVSLYEALRRAREGRPGTASAFLRPQ